MGTLIVSNRLPVTIHRASGGSFELGRSPGGLVAGLQEVHQQGDSLWIGHAGLFEREAGFAGLAEPLTRQRFVPVRIKRATYHAYYNGMSNGAIWPLFHYF